MNKNRPLFITFYGDMSFLIALLTIATLLFPNFFEHLGLHTISLPVFSYSIMKFLLPIILLVTSYGFLRLKIWGYWLMIIYIMFFLIVNIIECVLNKQTILYSNIVMTFIQLVFILPTKKYFDSKISVS